MNENDNKTFTMIDARITTLEQTVELLRAEINDLRYSGCWVYYQQSIERQQHENSKFCGLAPELTQEKDSI